jgi:hypothetical protein
MQRSTRRRFLRAGTVGGLLAIAGCSGLGGDDGDDGGGGDGEGGDGDATATPTPTRATSTAGSTATTTVERTTAAPSTAPPTTAPPTTAQPAGLGERRDTIRDSVVGGSGPRDVFEGLIPFEDRQVALGAWDLGDTAEGWVRSVDVGGSSSWNAGFDVATRATFFDAVEFDGAILAAGTARGRESSDLLLADAAADGTKGATATFGDGQTIGRGIARLGDGVVAAGAIADGSGLVGYGVSLAADGSVRWTQQYDSTDADETVFNTATPGPGQTALGGAVIQNGSARPWVVVVDESGQQTLSQVYDQPDGPSIKGMTTLQDGGLVVVGETRSAAEQSGEGFVGRLDSEGSLIWTDRVNPLDGNGALFDVVVDDGTLVVAGGVSGGSAVDAYVAGYDTDGTRRWQGRWGSSGVDLFSGVEPTESGYLCAGLTEWRRDAGDAWLALVERP